MAFQLPGSVQTNNPVLLHEWAGPFTGADATAAKAAANAYIPSGVRLKGLEVTLLISGTPAKYWYQNGTADTDLIPMPTGGGGGGSLTVQDGGSTVEGAATVLNFTGDGVTASGDGSGTATINIPGTSVPGISVIDLNLSNYAISTKGIYIVNTGTDYTGTVYKILFPAPSGFADGDEIVIINKDTNGLSAGVDAEDGYQYYQGTDKTISNIPWGMMYVFKKYSVGGGARWYCTPPTAQPTYDVYLVVAGSFYTYDIKTNGIYTIRTNSDNKDCKVYWPNPVNHAGQEITIINNSDFALALFSWISAPSATAWLPIYNTKTQSNIRIIQAIPVNSTYTFLSNGEFWYLKSSYPVINNITDYTSYNLNSGNIQLPQAGVYYVNADDAEVNTLKMPKGDDFPGQSITIINTNVNHPIKLDTSTSATSIYKGYANQLTTIRSGGIVTVNCILSVWYILDGETY